MGAARVFPELEELTLWNFGSDCSSSSYSSSSPFYQFRDWDIFTRLHTLKLNNLAFSDLLAILK